MNIILTKTDIKQLKAKWKRTFIKFLKSLEYNDMQAIANGRKYQITIDMEKLDSWSERKI